MPELHPNQINLVVYIFIKIILEFYLMAILIMIIWKLKKDDLNMLVLLSFRIGGCLEL